MGISFKTKHFTEREKHFFLFWPDGLFRTDENQRLNGWVFRYRPYVVLLDFQCAKKTHIKPRVAWAYFL